MPNISVRLNEQDTAVLDQLVEAQERYYEENPSLRTLAVNRSTALRDLLTAWKREMNPVEMFPPVEKMKK